MAGARRTRACGSVAVAGGVAANSGLRRALTEACEAEGLRLSLPPLSLCTDNAGMIGLAAGFLPALPWPDYLGLDAFASDAEAKAARPPRKRAARRLTSSRQALLPTGASGLQPPVRPNRLDAHRSADAGRGPDARLAAIMTHRPDSVFPGAPPARTLAPPPTSSSTAWRTRASSSSSASPARRRWT